MADNSTLLVNREKIIKYTQLSNAVDADKLTPFIKIAQDIEVQTVLGTKLYDKIVTDTKAGTLSGDYLTLSTDFIQPMLIQYSMADFLLFHGYTISNAGILRNTPEATALPGTDELKALVKRQRDIGEHYRDRLIAHLCYFPQLYPEYNQGQEDGEYPTSNKDNYSGINI